MESLEKGSQQNSVQSSDQAVGTANASVPASGTGTVAASVAAAANAASGASVGDTKVKTRQGSGYLKQLYSTARVTAGSTHSHLKNLTTFLVNFVPTEKVDPSELQVRVHFDPTEIEALSKSIKEHGVLQPILVVQDGDRYKVIAGERRLRAAKLAGIERIPARVLSTNDRATHEIALRENLDRADLHPLEEGEGYVSLLNAKAFASHDAIAQAFGKPKSRITECVGFTRLPDATKQELLRTGLRNRSLLRGLLNTPPEKHFEIIEEASKKEEVIILNSDQYKADGQTPSAESAIAGTSGDLGDRSKILGTTPGLKTKEPKPIKPFEYKCDEKGIQVPVFKWKVGEGPEKLKAYKDAMWKLMEEIESKFEKSTIESAKKTV